jgi:hypothetical protein
LERTLQLVYQAVEVLAWARQHSGDAERQRETDKAVALCQSIVEQVQAVGLSIVTDRIRTPPLPYSRVSGLPETLRWTPLVRQLGWRVKRESRGIIAPC